MNSLVWLFFALSFVLGVFISYRITRWYLRRKMYTKQEAFIMANGAYVQAQYDERVKINPRDMKTWFNKRSLHWLRKISIHPDFAKDPNEFLVANSKQD